MLSTQSAADTMRSLHHIHQNTARQNDGDREWYGHPTLYKYEVYKHVLLRLLTLYLSFAGFGSQFPQDGERGVLLFTATMTVVRNGRVQEVPFDTQTEAFDRGDRRGVTLPTVAAREAGGGQKVNGQQK